jgi:PAS domain S-box-containing protein
MALLWGETGILLFNDATAASIGPRHRDLQGLPVDQAFPDQEVLSREVLATCLKGQAMSVREREMPVDRGVGATRGWFDLDYVPVPDEDGRPAGVLLTVTDVTERRQAEEARRDGEAQLRALSDNLPGALVYQLETSRDLSARRYTYVSASVERLLGIPVRDALGDPTRWLRTVLDEDSVRLEEAEHRAARDLATLDIEVRSQHPDGRTVVSRVVSQPREIGGGRLLWDGMVLDMTAVRAAEAEHRRTAALLEAIGAATPDLIFAKDLQGRLLYANPAVAKLIGQPSETLLGRNEAEWAPGSGEAEAIARADRQIMEEGRTRVLEEVFTGADGQRRVFRTVKSPLRDETGTVVGLVGLSGDVTELHDQRDELERLNAHLEERVAEALAERRIWAEVFEATDAMVIVLDQDLRVMAANKANLDEGERATGRRAQVGDHLSDVLGSAPELIAGATEIWRRALSGEALLLEAEILGRFYELRFEPLRDAAGRIFAAFQIATDVTERKEAQRRALAAEAAQRQSDALYRAYFQNSAEGLFVVTVHEDGGFGIEEVNPAHRRAVGAMGLEPQPGKRLEEQLPPEIAAAVSANYQRVVDAGHVVAYRESADVGGQTLHFDTVLVPVRDDTGRIARIIGSARDMTAQVQAEEALRQSQKLESMGQLTGGVAHDFNNLLTPIIGSLDMLQRRGVGDDRMRRLVDGALQSAERAKTLVQRLLAFARRQPLQPVAVDLGGLVEGMRELVASTVGPRVRVETDVERGLPPVRADVNQLEMAILNLAVNARDAMPDGGTLRIEAGTQGVRPATLSRDGRYARLAVADTGTGMDELTLARAVEPFFSTKGVGRGTGLGLSMVHGLASQLGGAMEIQSRAGQGTTIALWLPLAEAKDAGDADALGTDPALAATGTVLLVDDEELVRASTSQMLAELGFAVTEASSAAEALALIDGGFAPDLVVTDHLMPGMTGTELVRVLRRRALRVPALLISGYAEDVGLAADLPRLTKPFRQAELAAAIGALRLRSPLVVGTAAQEAG